MKHTTPKLLRKHRVTHESGHALIFWHFGFVLGKVTVLPELEAGPTTAGYVKASFADCGNTSIILPPESLSAARAYSLMAGRVATEVYMPDTPAGNGHSFDFEELQKLTAPNPETLFMLRWKEQNPDATAEEFYQAHKGELMAILKTKQAQRAMEKLAGALDKAGTLSGAETAFILAQAWGHPLPPSALPTERHMAMTEEGPKNYNDLLRSIKTYVELALRDIKALRDAGAERENAHLDRIWGNLIHLKNFVL